MDAETPDPSSDATCAVRCDRLPIPVIETDRLRLRAHRLEDLPDCVAMWSDPVVTRYIGGKPSSPQQTWARLLGYLGHWAVLPFGYWVIESKSSGTFFGEIGFADYKRAIVPAMRASPEFGFALASHAQRHGYASEAARAVVGWADATLGATRTVALIDPANAASLHIAQTCGYRVFERALYNEKPALLLERERQCEHR